MRLSRFRANIYCKTIFACSGLSMPPEPPYLSEDMIADVCYARVLAPEIISDVGNLFITQLWLGVVANIAPGYFLLVLFEKALGSLFY